ncbi:MAG: DUF4834 family protein [Bacteroidaceae bacterium]|nr:DUF4834 family protein [Bacteroidaceae bacterium]
MFKGLFLLLIVFLVFVFGIFLSIAGTIARLFFKTKQSFKGTYTQQGNAKQGPQYTQHNSSKNTSRRQAPTNTSGEEFAHTHVIEENEGEYVDFEEIKE